MICYDSLLQTTTDAITKCDRYFITKRDKSLLQNASGFLLQNATVLLQNAPFITKCGVYYKLRQYNKESEENSDVNETTKSSPANDRIQSNEDTSTFANKIATLKNFFLHQNF